ncbi:MAG: hypothetical protein ACJ741_01825 [Pyrinomonadaceae bacterium]
MIRIFNWITWLTAVGLGVLMTLIQFGFARFFDDEGRLTPFWIVASIIIGVLSQLGLFLSPWSVRFKARYKIPVIVLMLPMVWILLGELSEDLGVGFDGHSIRSPSEHTLEIVVIPLVLVIYAGQLVNIFTSLIKQRRIVAAK